MTARQPSHDGKFDEKESVIAESKSRPLVIQLTRKLSVIAYFDIADTDAPESLNKARDDWELPLFPGESWFGG